MTIRRRFKRLFSSRKRALARHLGIDARDIEGNGPTFKVGGKSYAVLTETEAQDEARTAAFLLRGGRGRAPNRTPPIPSQWGRLIGGYNHPEEAEVGGYLIYQAGTWSGRRGFEDRLSRSRPR